MQIPTKEQKRQQLRQQLRNKRKALTESEQQHAASKVSDKILTLLKPGDVCALYLANDGELSPNLLFNISDNIGFTTLLPVMHPFKKGYLNFQLYTKTTTLVTNHFAILEPKLDSTQTYALNQIDYIFMPLVGFDPNGNRLGMGGGFYDRTLAKHQSQTVSPKLVGLAHDCQMVEQLPQQKWDIPLDLILTPDKIITPAGK